MKNDHFWPKIYQNRVKNDRFWEKLVSPSWLEPSIWFRWNLLSAELSFSFEIANENRLKFGPFSVHIYTTVLIGLFFCLFELSETKISKINFWMKIFDTFRLCWNSQIWLDNHNNRYQYTCNIEFERILRSFTVYTSVHMCSSKIGIIQNRPPRTKTAVRGRSKHQCWQQTRIWTPTTNLMDDRTEGPSDSWTNSDDSPWLVARTEVNLAQFQDVERSESSQINFSL